MKYVPVPPIDLRRALTDRSSDRDGSGRHAQALAGSESLRIPSREQPVERPPHRRHGHDLHPDVHLHVVRILPWSWGSQ